MPALVLLRLCAVIMLGISVDAAAAAGDWPCWRGPNHDGLSAEKGFRTDWHEPPPKLWERRIGSAFSGLSCAGGKVYTCGSVDKQQVVFCLDAETGGVIWQVPFEQEYREKQGGDGTRATPALADGRVYVIGARGKLICLDAASGKELWNRQFHTPPQWGYSGSVLVEGNLVIVPVGGEDGALRAFDKQTGTDVWKCGQGLVGYATPYPFTFEGTRYVVGFMGKQALIGELQTGRQVWSMKWETSWDVNAATPIFHDGRLLLSSGYDHGAILLKLARDAERLKADTVWENKSIRAQFQSPVLYEGHLYVSDEVGLKCVELATGQEKWHRRGVTHGTIVIADGHLLLLTEEGELQIARATPAGYQPTTSVQLLSGRHWTVPTLYQGRLYVRNLKQAACFDLR